ncbi:MAG: hypothetical protein RLZZ387_3074 [Chloroflexota bacterium]
MNVVDALAGLSGVEGVRWLLEGDEPQAALRRALGGLLTDLALLGACRLYRAKSKPGRYLTAYYEISVRGAPSDAEQRRHVEAVWLPPGTADPRGAPEDIARMQEEVAELGLLAPFRALVANDPSWGLWLQVSPLDAEYPQLARLSSPPHVRALLSALPELGAPPGDYTVEVVRYRPGQRHVLRYRPAGAPPDAALYAKVYSSDKGTRIFSTVRRVVEWLAADDAPISAVQPAAYLPEEQVALYRHVAGRPLSELLHLPEATEHLRLAGAGLRAIHRVPTDLVELRQHSLEKELQSIASASEHLKTLLPEAGARVTRMLARAQVLHERLPQEAPGFAYGDFKADHVWITPDGMTLIDFDTCYLFDQAIDLGKFLADLWWWDDGAGGSGAGAARSHFLEGYGPSPELLLRARLYEVLVLTKSTARRVKLFDPAWAERTGRLVALAEGLLSRLEAEVPG